MKTLILVLSLISLYGTSYAQLKYVLCDEQGRHIIPRGYVVNTEDGKGDIYYTPGDYQRMVRMGANFQVIRLKLGRLGGYPGNEVEESYLLHVDSLVQMAKNAGIRTDFKMTVHGTKHFSWTDFWKNQNSEFDFLIKAWERIWDRYRDESFVFGYDLLNEPMKGDLEVSYERMESAYLVPLYIRLIDVCQAINPEKKVFYQPLCIPIGPDWAVYVPPFIQMQTPINRDNIVYAPHIYEGDLVRFPIWMKQYINDAAVSNAPLFIGEWGPATFDRVDSSIPRQHEFIEFYIHTAMFWDSLGLGSIKPWFTGTRWKGKRPAWEGWDKNWWQAPYTWSIFSDNRGVGTAERKYITDVLARHYPDGFSIVCNKDFVLFCDPLSKSGIKVISTDGNSNASDFIWNPGTQQLVILKWPVDREEVHLRMVPGMLF
jgi:hypothetical protein